MFGRAGSPKTAAAIQYEIMAEGYCTEQSGRPTLWNEGLDGDISLDVDWELCSHGLKLR